jgi:hypothetical protein
VVNSLSILVASFSEVAKEGGVPHGGRLLPMPFTWVPREVNNEANFKDPIERGFLTQSQGSLATLRVVACPSWARTLTGR